MCRDKEKHKPVTIRRGTYGGFKVDEEEFFSHPDVIRQIEEMRKYDVLGRQSKSKKSSVEKSD